MSEFVREVDDQTFETEVLQASADKPVVVDFWAAWCGPCRQLAPLLEAAAETYADEVTVVKLDVDANQRSAASFGIQGIPAVKAFKDGKIVDEFTGVLPPPAIDAFFQRLAPSPADRLVAEGFDHPENAETKFREALELQSDHSGAAVALATILIDRDEIEEATAVLGQAVPTAEVEQAQARLALRNAGDVDELRSKVDAGDDDARVALGTSLAADGRYEEAIDVLLAGVAVPATKEEAREALLKLFALLGDEHPLTKASRPRLASALF